ncbi:MAG: TIGR04013 family B12-binding domain/radical SAM domain-containing protein [Archangium sp.]|nr:TIGR04013 family B12-binding domain/radical SAM domain-containing protein [Archangium sp.]
MDLGAKREVAVVFSFRSPGRYALTTLTGAIEGADDLRSVTVVHPRNTAEVIACIGEQLDLGREVIAGWSFYSPSFPECADELREVRAAEKRAFLAVAGGVHATAEPRQTLDAGFDLVCVGEGERVILEAIRAVRDGRPPSTIPGCARLETGAGDVVKQEARPPRIELDQFPPFAPRHEYFGPIEITRGCIYACRFCQTPYFSKARFRHRSVENTAHWVSTMREAGKRDLRFVSPTSLSYGSQDESVHLDAVEALLARSKEALGPEGRVYFGTFPSEVRPEHVTPEALALIKKYCANDNLVIGGQSGSDRVLQASMRGHDVSAIIHAVKISLAHGFVPNVDFILGLPGEAVDDLRASVNVMRQLGELGARVHAHTFMPLPGTPFRDAAPGQVDDETREELDRLASQKLLYGQWKLQERVAAEMAERRDQSARGYGSAVTVVSPSDDA